MLVQDRCTDEQLSFIRSCINSDRLLTPEEEALLVKLTRNSAVREDAMLALLIKFDKYLRKKAEGFRSSHGSNLSFDDLYQACRAALFEAVNAFNPSMGRLSTYLEDIVFRHMFDVMLEEIGISRHFFIQCDKIAKFRNSFKAEHGRDPNPDEIMNELDYTPKVYASIMAESEHLRSLSIEYNFDDVESDEGKMYFLDSVTCEPGIEDVIFSHDSAKAEMLEEALNSFEPLEREIIQRLYGLGDFDDSQSIAFISSVIGVSEYKVKTIRDRLLRILRVYLHEFETFYVQPKSLAG